MNQKFLKLLGGNEAYYPRALETQFARVFNKLLELWETKQADAYLQDLMMNTRGGTRKGFPPEVASEIFRLANYYNDLHELDKPLDVWSLDRDVIHSQVAKVDYKFTSKGFLQAVEEGDTELAVRLIDGGTNLNIRDERNWTPLIIAAAAGYQEIVLHLLMASVPLDARDFQGYTALHWAAFNDHPKIVKLLLRHGHEADVRSHDGWTPLMMAARHGSFLICALLIEQGADVNAQNKDGMSALHKAVIKGHAQVVKLLLSRNADPDAKNNAGTLTIDMALAAGNEEVIELLRLA
jgi:ankyrin repeat protein